MSVPNAEKSSEHTQGFILMLSLKEGEVATQLRWLVAGESQPSNGNIIISAVTDRLQYFLLSVSLFGIRTLGKIRKDHFSPCRKGEQRGMVCPLWQHGPLRLILKDYKYRWLCQTQKNRYPRFHFNTKPQ